MKCEERSDWEIVQRVQGGETDVFETLVLRHEKGIINLLYRWLGDYEEASEVAQEVFLSAYRFIKRFRGDAKFSTWLYRIAVNQAKTRRKGMMTSMQRMVPLESGETMGDSLQDPEEDAMRRETHDIVHQALGSMDGDDALIILMRDLQDIPYEEIARVLEVPNGTVKSRLHRARQSLKAKLAPYFQPA